MRYPTVAAAIKSGRLRKGLTQEQAAQRVGTSRFHWIRLEQGLHRPTEFAPRIAEVLGIDEKALVGDEDDEEAASMQALALEMAEDRILETLAAALNARLLEKRAAELLKVKVEL